MLALRERNPVMIIEQQELLGEGDHRGKVLRYLTLTCEEKCEKNKCVVMTIEGPENGAADVVSYKILYLAEAAGGSSERRSTSKSPLKRTYAFEATTELFF